MRSLEQEEIAIRGLIPEDLEAVIALDARITERRRGEYYRLKLQENLLETGIKVSLAAEVESRFAGFLLSRVYYGEFGLPEPAAVLDTIAVDPDFRERGVGETLVRHLRMHLAALGVGLLKTEVGWDDQGLLTFFHHNGFRPAARFSLEMEITHLP